MKKRKQIEFKVVAFFFKNKLLKFQDDKEIFECDRDGLGICCSRNWEFPDYLQTVVGLHNVKPPAQLSQRTNRLLILLGEMREKK